jgi:CHAT domain
VVAYLDFDLRIEHSGDAYLSRVLDSPAGEASATFSVPFSPVEIENLILKVSHSIGRRDVRRIESPEVQSVMAFGARLFDAVFADDVRACLRSSITEATHQEAGLRIRLRLGDVPELIDLPWEYLYNPTLDRFLARQLETPIVRYLDLAEPIRPLAIRPPVRVLVMISSPSDYPSLDVDLEFERLRDALSGLEADGLVTLERLDEATLPALRQRLRRGQHQVFHFVGHGGFDESQDDGVVVLEDEVGRGHMLSGRSLGEMLRGFQPVRLAVLNACEGARNGTTDPFAGAAQSMVQQGIAAVIAMQFEITDTAAIVFAQEFYAAIADGYPVDAALGEARRAIFSQGNELEWATPVLYMRAADGRVFDIDRSLPARPEEPDLGTSDPHRGVEKPRGGMDATLEPATIAVDPGQRASAHLTVRNTGEAGDRFNVSLIGEVPAWVSLEPDSLALDAGEEGGANVNVAPPEALEAGASPIGITVEVTSSQDPTISATERGFVEVGSASTRKIGWTRRHRRVDRPRRCDRAPAAGIDPVLGVP